MRGAHNGQNPRCAREGRGLAGALRVPVLPVSLRQGPRADEGDGAPPQRAPRHGRHGARARALPPGGCAPEETRRDEGGTRRRLRVLRGHRLDAGEGLGVTDDQLRALPRFRESTAFSPVEKLVLEYAAEMTRTPAVIPDHLYGALSEYFEEAQMVELTAAIAWENHRARFNDA